MLFFLGFGQGVFLAGGTAIARPPDIPPQTREPSSVFATKKEQAKKRTKGGVKTSEVPPEWSYHRTSQALPWEGREEKLWEEILLFCKEKKRLPPRLSGGLQRAARRLTSNLSQKPSPVLGQGWVDKAMHLAGQSDAQIQIFAMGWEDESLLLRSFRQSLKAMLEDHGATDIGLAIQGEKLKVAMVIFSRRGLQMQPLPAWLGKEQSAEFRGQLRKGFSLASLVIGHPDASTQTYLLKPTKDGRFSYRWKAPEEGTFRFQILAQDHRGPWISSQWEITVVPSPEAIPLLAKRATREAEAHFGLNPAATSASSETDLDPAMAAQALFEAINDLRRENKIDLLHRHPRLDKFALQYAQEMTKYGFFGHTSPRTGSFEKRFRRLGWRAEIVRENLVTAATAKEALRLLTDSPAHRSNLYASLLVWTGIAASRSKQGRLVFVQVFVSSP